MIYFFCWVDHWLLSFWVRFTEGWNLLFCLNNGSFWNLAEIDGISLQCWLELFLCPGPRLPSFGICFEAYLTLLVVRWLPIWFPFWCLLRLLTVPSDQMKLDFPLLLEQPFLFQHNLQLLQLSLFLYQLPIPDMLIEIRIFTEGEFLSFIDPGQSRSVIDHPRLIGFNAYGLRAYGRLPFNSRRFLWERIREVRIDMIDIIVDILTAAVDAIQFLLQVLVNGLVAVEQFIKTVHWRLRLVITVAVHRIII